MNFASNNNFFNFWCNYAVTYRVFLNYAFCVLLMIMGLPLICWQINGDNIIWSNAEVKQIVLANSSDPINFHHQNIQHQRDHHQLHQNQIAKISDNTAHLLEQEGKFSHTTNEANSDLNILHTNYSGHHLSRVRRGIVQLASMIKCVSGCTPIQYKGYGCFCGLFGSGKPVDAIDRCCLKHDWCYSNAPCHQFLLYLTPYSWNCPAPGYAECAYSDYAHKKNKCAFSLCECDRVFAECISRYPCPEHKAPCPYKQMVYVVGK
ncbi:uncharacterized protein LOC141850277 [Brevipalpus obovatus]|uniref:uncharacterized protein LOC141850277 n=1 Tax=Brevipalpus obovatus TaxID=246614 RepID=UPI003D9E54EE